MSLKKTIVTPMGLPGNYVHIEGVRVKNAKHGKLLEAEVKLYADKAAYDIGANAMMQLDHERNSSFTFEVTNDDLDGISVLELAYEKLKELEMFAGAEDV